jgi:hypothetical protein
MYATSGAGQRVDLDVHAVVTALRDRYARRFEPWAPRAEGVASFSAAPAAARLAEIFDEVTR